MKRLSEGGFGVVAIILFVVMIFLIGTAGWYIHGHHASSKPSGKTVNEKIYTDGSHTYQLTYPAAWTVTTGPSDNDMGTATDNDFPTFIPDNGAALPCNATNCGSNDRNGIDVASYKQSNPDSVFEKGWYPMQKQTINGYSAYYKHLNFGNSVWDNFFVVHNGYLLDFTFTEKRSGAFGSFDDSRHVANFDKLVRTIKFLR